MKATNSNGNLEPIEECYIDVPGYGKITMNALPDISDSKSASYSDEAVIGRSFPIKAFSHSENRSISWTVHMYIQAEEDLSENIFKMRALESAVYTQDGNGQLPFKPPPICKIKCGSLLGDKDLCVVLKQYSVKFPTDTSWASTGSYYTPYKFDIDLTFEAVYAPSNLPGQQRILDTGQ